MHVAKVSIDPYEERESYFQDVVMQIYAKQFAISVYSFFIYCIKTSITLIVHLKLSILSLHMFWS